MTSLVILLYNEHRIREEIERLGFRLTQLIQIQSSSSLTRVPITLALITVAVRYSRLN